MRLTDVAHNSINRSAIIAAIVIPCSWVIACSPPATPERIRTAVVEKRNLKARVHAHGRLEARDPIDVLPRVESAVVEVSVAAGEAVTKDQPLGRLNTEEAENRVLLNRAQFEARQGRELLASLAVQACRRDLARAEELAKSGQGEGTALENTRHVCLETQAKLSVASAERRHAATLWAAAERDVERGTIRAPRDGVVLLVPSRLGTWARPGSALFRVGAPLNELMLEAQVADADMARLKVGQECSFEVGAFPGRQFSAEVTHLGIRARTTEADPTAATYTVRLRAPNPHGDLLPGMPARVTFVVGDVRGALVAHEAALHFAPTGAPEAPPRTRVFKQVGPDRLEPVSVRVGISDGRFVELRNPAGLDEGDLLAIGYQGARASRATANVPKTR